MVETRYLDAAEVAGIPTLDRAPAAVAYAPATSEAFKADVVLLAVTPAQSTLVFEAALKAGIARGSAGATSRPSCAILPASAKTEIVDDLVRLQGQPDVHHGRRRRDVRRDSGRRGGTSSSIA